MVRSGWHLASVQWLTPCVCAVAGTLRLRCSWFHRDCYAAPQLQCTIISHPPCRWRWALNVVDNGDIVMLRLFSWHLVHWRRLWCDNLLQEEADLLADWVVILAAGRLAAQGTPLQLKAEYGVGYTLTVSLSPRAASAPSGATDSSGTTTAAEEQSGRRVVTHHTASSPSPEADMQHDTARQLLAVVSELVPGAAVVSASAREVTLRLPKEQSHKFSQVRLQHSATCVTQLGRNVRRLPEVLGCDESSMHTILSCYVHHTEMLCTPY